MNSPLSTTKSDLFKKLYAKKKFLTKGEFDKMLTSILIILIICFLLTLHS